MKVELSDKQLEQLKDRIQGFINASIISMNKDSEDWGLGEMEELHELKSVVDVKIDRVVPYVGIKTYINIYTDSKREDFDMFLSELNYRLEQWIPINRTYINKIVRVEN